MVEYGKKKKFVLTESVTARNIESFFKDFQAGNVEEVDFNAVVDFVHPEKAEERKNTPEVEL